MIGNYWQHGMVIAADLKSTKTIKWKKFLAVASPAAAQTTDNTAGTTTAMDNDNDDDSGKWGLAGLAGLLGLLGLRRRDDDNRTRTTNVNR